MKLGLVTTGRFASIVIILLTVGLLAVGCGGSGDLSDSGGGNSVRVSAAQTSTLQAGAVAANAPSGGGSASQNIDNVFITVTKVALLPGGGGGQPDLNGEVPVVDSGQPEAGIIVSTLLTPRTVDLLHLPGADVALLLNSFDNVPAGTYGKIRLYYMDPKVHFIGDSDNTAAHPTANYHLDIKFVDGGLVIPVIANPGREVSIFDVTIRVVLGGDGFKVTVNPSNIIIRPQVFADLAPPVAYEVSGTVSAFLGGNTFDLITSDSRTFHVEFDPDTDWSFQDPMGNRTSVTSTEGRSVLDNGMSVIVIGTFRSVDTLAADSVVVIWIRLR